MYNYIIISQKEIERVNIYFTKQRYTSWNPTVGHDPWNKKFQGHKPRRQYLLKNKTIKPHKMVSETLLLRNFPERCSGRHMEGNCSSFLVDSVHGKALLIQLIFMCEWNLRSEMVIMGIYTIVDILVEI